MNVFEDKRAAGGSGLASFPPSGSNEASRATLDQNLSRLIPEDLKRLFLDSAFLNEMARDSGLHEVASIFGDPLFIRGVANRAYVAHVFEVPPGDLDDLSYEILRDGMAESLFGKRRVDDGEFFNLIGGMHRNIEKWERERISLSTLSPQPLISESEIRGQVQTHLPAGDSPSAPRSDGKVIHSWEKPLRLKLPRLEQDHVLKPHSYRAGMAINLDGGFIPGGRNTYGPNNTGIDHTANAKNNAGKWVGIVTDKDGNAIIQGKDDPNPGYYVSQTTWEDKSYPERSPLRYFNSLTQYGIVAKDRMHMDHIATVVDIHTEKYIHALVYDKGNSKMADAKGNIIENEPGEASLAVAKFFGAAVQTKAGRWVGSEPVGNKGEKGRFRYFIYPDSAQRPRRAITNEQIYELGERFMRHSPDVRRAIAEGFENGARAGISR